MTRSGQEEGRSRTSDTRGGETLVGLFQMNVAAPPYPSVFSTGSAVPVSGTDITWFCWTEPPLGESLYRATRSPFNVAVPM